MTIENELFRNNIILICPKQLLFKKQFVKDQNELFVTGCKRTNFLLANSPFQFIHVSNASWSFIAFVILIMDCILFHFVVWMDTNSTLCKVMVGCCEVYDRAKVG